MFVLVGVLCIAAVTASGTAPSLPSSDGAVLANALSSFTTRQEMFCVEPKVDTNFEATVLFEADINHRPDVVGVIPVPSEPPTTLRDMWKPAGGHGVVHSNGAGEGAYLVVALVNASKEWCLAPDVTEICSSLRCLTGTVSVMREHWDDMTSSMRSESCATVTDFLDAGISAPLDIIRLCEGTHSNRRKLSASVNAIALYSDPNYGGTARYAHCGDTSVGSWCSANVWDIGFPNNELSSCQAGQDVDLYLYEHPDTQGYLGRLPAGYGWSSLSAKNIDDTVSSFKLVYTGQAAPAVAPSSSSPNQSSDQSTIIQSHDSTRTAADSNIPNVTWDADLAASAQAYADTCPMGHAADHSTFGENLAWSTGTLDWLSAIQMWIDEKSFFSYPDTCEPGKDCGHYTQMVWRDSISIGCGRRTGNCPASNQWTDYFVCRYSPPGNYVGEAPY